MSPLPGDTTDYSKIMAKEFEKSQPVIEDAEIRELPPVTFTKEDIHRAEKFMKNRKLKHVIDDAQRGLNEVDTIVLAKLIGVLLNTLKKHDTK